MGYMTNSILAMILIFIGVFFSITIVGAIIGIPMILLGIYLGLRAKKQSITEGVEEALKAREREEKEDRK